MKELNPMRFPVLLEGLVGLLEDVLDGDIFIWNVKEELQVMRFDVENDGNLSERVSAQSLGVGGVEGHEGSRQDECLAFGVCDGDNEDR